MKVDFPNDLHGFKLKYRFLEKLNKIGLVVFALALDPHRGIIL